jgi:hypothetical protein
MTNAVVGACTDGVSAGVEPESGTRADIATTTPAAASPNVAAAAGAVLVDLCIPRLPSRHFSTFGDLTVGVYRDHPTGRHRRSS